MLTTVKIQLPAISTALKECLISNGFFLPFTLDVSNGKDKNIFIAPTKQIPGLLNFKNVFLSSVNPSTLFDDANNSYHLTIPVFHNLEELDDIINTTPILVFKCSVTGELVHSISSSKV